MRRKRLGKLYKLIFKVKFQNMEVDMIFGLVILIVVGLIFLYLAYSIGKGNMELIHSYHTKNVAERDRKAYGSLFSNGMFLIGLSMLFASCLLFFEKVQLGVIVLFLGIVSGVFIMSKAQNKYNGGWFL